MGIIIVSMLVCVPSTVKADAIGTWKLYPCYSDVKEIVPVGSDVFVLASGNLYSYNVNDNSLTEYNKTNCLTSSDIAHIAWVQQAKRLVVTYSDCTIDLLSLNQDVTTINDIKDKQMTGNKTINDIYVNGKYAYLSTGFGVIKLNVSDAYIADTYNLGYNVDYCYIKSNTIFAASSSVGLMGASLNSNLLDRNIWSSVGTYTPKPQEAYVQDTHNNCYWGTNEDSQLSKYRKQEDGTFQVNTTFVPVKPDGPVSNHFYELTIADDVLYAGAGTIHPMYNNRNFEGQIHKYINGEWTSLSEDIATITGHRYRQINKVIVDPTNSNHIVAFGQTGIYEFLNDKLYRHWNCKNSNDGVIGSAIPNASVPEDWNIIIGACFDNNGGLWVPCYTGILYLAKGSETWENHGHSEVLVEWGCEPYFSSVFIDSRGLLWFAAIRGWNGKVLFYDIKNDKLKRYDSFVNQDGTQIGNYSNIFRVVPDCQDNIWIATQYGPVYLSSSDVYSGVNCFTQHKVPRNDGTNYADYLLAGVDVRCIAVDAFNRKWIGTSGSGIYLISSDCNTQLAHFTTENSCLPSDEVLDLAINPNDGRLWISTFAGICSYQSDINSDSGDEMNEASVYAYPNPVTPEHSGDITIVGMRDGAQISIATSSGHVVCSGVANGGSFRWDGCDTAGRKVASGIYMVLVATSDGSKGVVSKIAVVR